MDSFAHPFRFSAGNVVKIDDQTDAFAAQVIAAALKTQPGELVITDDFGCESAEFMAIDGAGLVYSISRYHPTITIDSITEEIFDDERRVAVEFTRQEL
jgi:phage baseplate assembly protein W